MGCRSEEQNGPLACDLAQLPEGGARASWSGIPAPHWRRVDMPGPASLADTLISRNCSRGAETFPSDTHAQGRCEPAQGEPDPARP